MFSNYFIYFSYEWPSTQTNDIKSRMYLKCLSAILRFSILHTSLFDDEIENRIAITNLKNKCCKIADNIAELLGNVLQDEGKSTEQIAVCMEIAETLAQLAENDQESLLIGDQVKALAKNTFKQCKQHSGFKKRVLLLKKS